MCVFYSNYQMGIFESKEKKIAEEMALMGGMGCKERGREGEEERGKVDKGVRCEERDNRERGSTERENKKAMKRKEEEKKTRRKREKQSPKVLSMRNRKGKGHKHIAMSCRITSPCNHLHYHRQ